jgi:hypothetical protein
MKFEWQKSGASLDGELLYRAGEYSIDFEVACDAPLAERVGSAGNTSLSFATLQVEVGIEHGELLYPWGLFPNTCWQVGNLTVPALQAGRVRVVVGEDPLQAGVAVLFSDSSAWPVVWDPNSGWICFGNVTSRFDAIAIEYAKNSVAVIADGQLLSLWLRPKMAQ